MPDDYSYDSSFLNDPYESTYYDYGSSFPDYSMDYSSYSDPYAGMLYDTQTGQYVTAQQAQQIDPQAYQQYSSTSGQLGQGQAAWDARMGQAGGGAGSGLGLNAGTLGLGAAGLTALVGLAGVIQKANQGDQQSVQTVQRLVAGASPQELQALNQNLSALSGLQNFTLGGSQSLQARLGARATGEDQLWNQGAMGLSNQAGQTNQMLFGGGQQGMPQQPGQQPMGGPGPLMGGGQPGMPQQPVQQPAAGAQPGYWMGGGQPGHINAPQPGQQPQPAGQQWGLSSPGGGGYGPGVWNEQTGQVNPQAAGGQLAGLPYNGPGGQSYGQPGMQQQNGQQGLVPQMFGQTGQMGNEQAGILSAFAPTMQGIAQGQIPQLLSQLVEQAYQPQMGDITRQAIESARNRGFAGGAELLNQGPAGSIAGPALADLQGQMAQSKLGLLQTLPQSVATASGAYSTPMALRGQMGSNLSTLNQSLMSSLGGLGQQGIQNGVNFIGAGSGLVNAGTGFTGSQQAGRIGSAGSTTTTTQPYSLLDSFAPLASILGGVGGALNGYANSQRQQPGYTLSGWG